MPVLDRAVTPDPVRHGFTRAGGIFDMKGDEDGAGLSEPLARAVTTPFRRPWTMIHSSPSAVFRFMGEHVPMKPFFFRS